MPPFGLRFWKPARPSRGGRKEGRESFPGPHNVWGPRRCSKNTEKVLQIATFWPPQICIKSIFGYQLSFTTMSRYRKLLIVTYPVINVYLTLRYLLTKSTNDSNCNCIEYDQKLPFTHDHGIHNILRPTHGPPMVFPQKDISLLSVDNVSCVRCLLWSPRAADWPTRHRNYGWPDSATLDRVVSNGCDLVGVTHRQCIDNVN